MLSVEKDVIFYVLIATTIDSEGLESILFEFDKVNLNFQVVVIENGEKGNSEYIVNKFKGRLSLSFIYTNIKGKSHALNLALKSIPDDSFIFFTDDDVKISEDLILSYKYAIKKYGRGYYFGGEMKVEYEVEPEDWLKKFLPVSALGWKYCPNEHNLKYFFGCNWGAFKSDLDRAGEFNTDLGPGSSTGATGQESDMQKRLFANNIRPIYIEKAWVTHYVPVSRCNYKWALKRRYKDGKQSGINDNFLDVSRTFLGYPVAIIKELMIRLPIFVYCKVFLSKEKSAVVIFDFYYRFGRMVGHKYRRKSSLL